METDNSNTDISIDESKKNKKSATSEYIQNEILEKYDIFSNVYESSDNLSFVDSEEDMSYKDLDENKNKNVLSLAVYNIINVYPNNERNREFKKYKQQKLKEKKQKEFEAQREIIEQKKKIYEEKRQKKLEIYNIQKKKKKLVERAKFNKDNIEYNYLTILDYFNYLMDKGKRDDIYFSFHDLYISPMRLYYVSNLNIDQIYYLDLSRKWLSDNYIPLILQLCKQKNIKILNVSYNKLTFKCLADISKFLSENKNLYALNLEHNDLTNNGQNVEEINMLFETIKNKKTIKILNLSNTNMNKNNGDKLCEMLENNKAIIEMNFENSDFTCDQNCKIIKCLIRNKNIWLHQAEIEKEENEKMEKEENYMHTYHMSVEASIIDIKNKEKRQSLNKMVYVNMWKKEIKEKEQNKKNIYESLEKEHEKRIKRAAAKKKKQKKK
ncbi:conserved protein, unknown function [Hepatocystis sp. ex Piliocolobus tephrosceles]|nr:conserved protein, unknown function [Hepatocystis sp. ex Piliocolobus tephrosceles]